MLFAFFKNTATTEIYTLSLHDALPILAVEQLGADNRETVAPPEALERLDRVVARLRAGIGRAEQLCRSEEHTSELQSLRHLVCRLLLEKKKQAEGGTQVGGLPMPGRLP